MRTRKKQRTSPQRYDADKMRELVLYIARRSEADPFFGAVKLNKVLFFADFYAYRTYGRSITGAEYQRLDHGPAPRQLKPLLDRMRHEGTIAVRKSELGGYSQSRTLALREPVLGKFTPDEIALVDHIILDLWSTNASDASTLSHRFMGWQLAKRGETIPYAVGLLSRREPTEAERVWGLKLGIEAATCLAR